MTRDRTPDAANRRLIEGAHQLLQAGDEPGAELLLQQCWEARDAEWSARAGLDLGEIWLRRGRLPDAIQILRQAIETWGHPVHGAQAMITLAVALARSGDLAGAEAQYRTLLQIGHPVLKEVARFNLAELAHGSGRIDEAVALYQAVASSGHPEMGPRAAANLGVLRSELGRLELARDPESEPTVAEADRIPVASGLRQGREAEARGDLALAEDLYRVASDLGSGEAASNLGVLLFERGEVEAAEATLRRADQRRHPIGTFRLGFLLEETGRAAEAAAVYARAAALGSVSAMNNLATILERRGDLDGARALIQQVLATTTDAREVSLARHRLASLDGKR